jgi:hypothetical protein
MTVEWASIIFWWSTPPPPSPAIATHYRDPRPSIPRPRRRVRHLLLLPRRQWKPELQTRSPRKVATSSPPAPASSMEGNQISSPAVLGRSAHSPPSAPSMEARSPNPQSSQRQWKVCHLLSRLPFSVIIPCSCAVHGRQSGAQIERNHCSRTGLRPRSALSRWTWKASRWCPNRIRAEHGLRPNRIRAYKMSSRHATTTQDHSRRSPYIYCCQVHLAVCADIYFDQCYIQSDSPSCPCSRACKSSGEARQGSTSSRFPVLAMPKNQARRNTLDWPMQTIDRSCRRCLLVTPACFFVTRGIQETVLLCCICMYIQRVPVAKFFLLLVYSDQHG